MKNTLLSFDRAILEAWQPFKEAMERLGWECITRDNSNVHLEIHERGKNKGLFECSMKQFWKRSE